MSTHALDERTRAQVVDAIDRLAEAGPALGRPLVDSIAHLSVRNLKELRPGSAGRSEVHVLFAFDPWRSAILLTGGDKSGDWQGWYRRAPGRSGTSGAIDWSYGLLSGPERELFGRLSVFVGGFTLEAAEEVCGDEGAEQTDVLELLSRLVDQSLVVPDDAGHVRFRMLETLRRYAAARHLPRRAATLLGAAESIRRRTGTPLPPHDRADIERATDAAVSALGQEAFTRITEQSRQMSAQEATTYALSENR